jgi:hypothetical protein
MENTTKHNKNDWIRNLCDDILVNILSLLTIKEAVQTCILSRRWSDVWAYVPVLNFHVDDFSKNKSVTSQIKNERIYEDRLVRFVNGVLTNRETLPLDIVKYFCQQRNSNCYSLNGSTV